MAEPTILIIGAGTFGTSTAYYLAQTYADPTRVTLLDRWSPSSPISQKHAAAIDVNRIIRTDYASPLYCNLANEAIHPWFWSLELGHFFHKTGWVVLDEKKSEYAESVRSTFRERGGDYTRDVDVQELGRKWGFRTQGYDGRTYFNPEAGWCDAEQATANFMDAAVKKGVRRVTGEAQELLLNDDGAGLRGVKLNNGQILSADKIVLATGAWTSSLLSPIEDTLHMPAQDRIERQIQAVGRVSAYYNLSSDEAAHLSKMPITVFGEDLVAIPPSAQNKTLKINDVKTEFVNTAIRLSGQKVSVPSPRDQIDVPERLKREVEERVQNVMPELAKKADRWRICWDAKTPSEDFLLCKHSHGKLSNLYLAVGGSFHSYKFMPIAGKYIANVLRGQSNGIEKDQAWGWKTGEQLKKTRRKELGAKPRATVKTELKDYEKEQRRARL